MTEFYKNQNDTLFGTKIYNYNTKQIGLIIFTWTNIYADAEVPFATCVDKNGKKYNIAMDCIRPLEDFDDDELEEFGLNK